MKKDEEIVETFFSHLASKLSGIDRMQREDDKINATRFNLFERYLGRRETTLSRVLSDLLDPDGLHGQGSFFLEKFLSIVEISQVQGLEKAKVRTEHKTRYLENPDRSIDIFIETESFVMAIENKPWAYDQPKQMKDYWTEVRAVAGARESYLVYLPGDGSDPAKESIDREDWQEIKGIKLPYNGGKSLKLWVENCLKERELPSKMRHLLEDFKGYIDSEFKGSF